MIDGLSHGVDVITQGVGSVDYGIFFYTMHTHAGTTFRPTAP